MRVAVLIAYILGGSLGALAIRNATFARIWPVFVRSQMVAAPIVLSIAAVWRIDSLENIVWPVLLMGGVVAMLGVATVTAETRDQPAIAVLRTMSAAPNSGFFVMPIAAAFGGSAAAVIAVLMDRAATFVWSWWIAILRKHAPTPQSKRTGFTDQAGLIALAVGAALHLAGSAPDWTSTVVLWCAPIIAGTGAATFVGSALHPSQRIDHRPGTRRYAMLVLSRIVIFGLLALAAPNDAVRLVAMLCALSIPTFATPQFATLYGYAEPVVAAGNRYGWLLGAAGAAGLWLMTH